MKDVGAPLEEASEDNDNEPVEEDEVRGSEQIRGCEGPEDDPEEERYEEKEEAVKKGDYYYIDEDEVVTAEVIEWRLSRLPGGARGPVVTCLKQLPHAQMLQQIRALSSFLMYPSTKSMPQ